MSEPSYDVSVLIPTYPARAAMYAEAVQSVHAQTLSSDRWEIVTKSAAQWYPDKINDMLRSAVGRYVIFLGDDDRLDPRALGRMVEEADRTGAPIVSASVQCFGESHATVHFSGVPWTRESFTGGPPIWITSLVDREQCLAAGGFDFARLGYGDWALWYELFKRGATHANIPEVLWYYRDHAEQASKRIDGLAHRAAFFTAYPELFRAAA